MSDIDIDTRLRGSTGAAANSDRAAPAIAGRTDNGPSIVRRLPETVKGKRVDAREWTELCDDVDEFNTAMLEKLAQNLHKESYLTQSPVELLALLEQEVRELREEIEKDGEPFAVVMEAADVANFAMMVAAVVTKGWEPGWHIPDERR